MRRLLLAELLGVLLWCGPFSAAAASSERTPAQPALDAAASPALFPAFRTNVTDYVTRCAGNRGVGLSLLAGRGTEVAADGRRARTGPLHVRERILPGQAFTFTARTATVRRSYSVRCLPPRFPRWTFRRLARSRGHWTLVSPGLGRSAVRPYAAIFDANGVPVWWYRVAPAPADLELLPDHTLAIAHFGGGTFGVDPAASWAIRRLNGRLVRTVRTVGAPTDQHDIQLTPSGDYLLLSYVPRPHVDLTSLGGPVDATVEDAEIQLVDRKGRLVWSWHSKDHVALAESAAWHAYIASTPVRLPNGRTVYDIVHANSVQLVGRSVILSLRHTDAVYDIDRATGSILWKLGGTRAAESLTVVGDPLGPHSLAGQHDVRLLSDGTLTLHDNGTDAGRPPRALRFRIDSRTRTATFVEQVRDRAVKSSPCCGSATRLPGGGWVVSWGGQPRVGEYSGRGGRVWTMGFAEKLFSYRALPVADGVLTLRQLRAAMNTMHPR